MICILSHHFAERMFHLFRCCTDIESTMRTAILAITDQGRVTAKKIHESLPGSDLIPTNQGIKKSIEHVWSRYDCVICVMAAGIVVRCIAPLCRSKFEDPAVVVVDEQCRFAISLLSGHVGGANEMATQLEKKCGAVAVVTTASDISGHTALDLWAMDNNLYIRDPKLLASIAARLLNNGSLSVFQDDCYIVSFPHDFTEVKDPHAADIIISTKKLVKQGGLQLVPRILSIGFGCRRGVTADEFQHALDELSAQYDIHLGAVENLASIDLKRDEVGLIGIAEKHNWPVKFFTKEQINAICPSSKKKHGIQ